MTLPLVVEMTVDTGNSYELSAETNQHEINLDNELEINVVGYDVPEYEGSYTVDAGLSPVVLNTQDKRLTQNVTVNALTENQVTGNSLTINTLTGKVSSLVSISAGYSPSVFGVSKSLQLSTQERATITPTTSEQTAVTRGKYTTGAVKVRAIPTGTRGTPIATKGTVSNHSVSVTPSVTNTTGYITGGTINGTAVSVSASELVSGSLSITTNNTYDVTNYASAVVNVAGVSGYTITNNLTNISTNNATTEVVANQPYYAILTVETGTFSACTVTMGNTDITSTAFNQSDMSITISSVTGNVVITASATAESNFVVKYQGNFTTSTPSNTRVTLISKSITLEYGETLTVTANSGYVFYLVEEYGTNGEESRNRTAKGTNQIYVYAINNSSGYVYTINDYTFGPNNGARIRTGAAGWSTSKAASIANSNVPSITFDGIGVFVEKGSTSSHGSTAITTEEAESAISWSISQPNANQILSVLLGEETV